MARYLVRLRNTSYDREDCEKLTREVRKRLHNLRTGNLRISESAIEFDLFTEGDNNPPRSMATLDDIGPLLTVRRLDVAQARKSGKEETMAMARSLFNDQRYWECHEALEEVWRSEKGQERGLLQGIILVASALVHWQKGEDEVCLSMLRRALDKFDWPSSEYHGIAVQHLREQVAKMIETGGVKSFLI